MEASLQASLECNLKALRLPTMLRAYSHCARDCLSEKCSYEQYLLTLVEKELEARNTNRVRYLLKNAKFPKNKTLSDFDFTQSDIQKASILALCDGHFLSEAYNIILYGLSGTGKTHLAIGIGRELCLRGFRVLFTTACHLVQELVRAKNNLALSAYLKKIMAYDLVIIDEMGYIPFEKSEGDLLFQFISDRYERKSILITTNLSFSEWDVMFSDRIVATAAIDRLVHYSQIYQFKGSTEESFRAKEAKKRAKNGGANLTHVTD